MDLIVPPESEDTPIPPLSSLPRAQGAKDNHGNLILAIALKPQDIFQLLTTPRKFNIVKSAYSDGTISLVAIGAIPENYEAQLEDAMNTILGHLQSKVEEYNHNAKDTNPEQD